MLREHITRVSCEASGTAAVKWRAKKKGRRGFRTHAQTDPVRQPAKTIYAI